jgi:CheY-like chemotaxis protein
MSGTRTQGTSVSVSKDILVIDDDDLMRDGIAELLTEAGYAARTAADGNAGLNAVKTTAPALVVTDIFMPGTSGKTVISELSRTHPNIPIIAISGHFNSDRMDAESAILLGAARVLSKPFKNSDLLATVADLLAASA